MKNVESRDVAMKAEEMKNFNTGFEVSRMPEEVFKAINNVRGWWSGEIKGETATPGAEFTYIVPGAHYSRQRVTEMVVGERVVWHVVDAELTFVKDKSEWKGTDIVFDIKEHGEKTRVHFQHIGLVPEFECYKDCSNAWGMLINGNLKRLIETGEVQPSPW